MNKMLLTGKDALPVFGPGTQTLLHGTLEHGFYGEVSTAEVGPNANELASLCGLVEGNSRTLQSWLKFSLNGKTIFIPKKPIRTAISWNTLNAAGCVTGTKIIEIDGYRYKVRLPTGANNSPVSDPDGWNGNPTSGFDRSEWNLIFYNIHRMYTNRPIVWANYSHADLQWAVNGDHTSSTCWSQNRTHSGEVVTRGGFSGIRTASHDIPNARRPSSAWRPILELVG